MYHHWECIIYRPLYYPLRALQNPVSDPCFAISEHNRSCIGYKEDQERTNRGGFLKNFLAH